MCGCLFVCESVGMCTFMCPVLLFLSVCMRKCGDPLLPPEEASQRRRSSNQMMIFLFIYDYIPYFSSYMKSLPC